MLLPESIEQDIRYAIPAMRNSVGLTAVAILSLALGIGATIAIFSVIYVLALRQLPVSQPDRVVGVEGQLGNLHAYSEWKLFRDRRDFFSVFLLITGSIPLSKSQAQRDIRKYRGSMFPAITSQPLASQPF